MAGQQQKRDEWIVRREDFPRLFEALRGRGYTLIGPTVRDGAIVYDEVASVSDLPIGWTDEQEAGTYRLKKRRDKALFGYVVGPHSWKKFLHPPHLRLWQAERQGTGFKVLEEERETSKFDFSPQLLFTRKKKPPSNLLSYRTCTLYNFSPPQIY